MKITFIGNGNVGGALANNLQKAGHQVTIALKELGGESETKAKELNQNFNLLEISKACGNADVVFLAVPFGAVEDALSSAGDLTGKIVVDCTNPVAAGFKHGLNNEKSGTEFVQELVPDAKVVKSFTIYGFENFIDSNYPNYKEVRPAMLIAGNDTASKEIVRKINNDLGYDTVDTGDASQALHLEHMTLLWIKMARVQGKGSGFTWAILER